MPTCDELIAAATDKMERGRKMRGRGMRFGDKALEQKGLDLYDEGKRLLDEAAALSPECAEKVEALTKKNSKYRSHTEEIDHSKTYY